MRYLLLPLCFAFFLLAACGGGKEYVQNPDPNHTHADFAVWMDGEQLNFSDPAYMSGVSYDDATHDEKDEYRNKHLHLHDEVGSLVHSHKPELTLKEFFDSVDVSFDNRAWRMFLRNGKSNDDWEEVSFDIDYFFQDMDQVLITDSTDDVVVEQQKGQMTDDACLYSKTCPWRGDPPTENCIADPAVPCVE